MIYVSKCKLRDSSLTQGPLSVIITDPGTNLLEFVDLSGNALEGKCYSFNTETTRVVFCKVYNEPFI